MLNSVMSNTVQHCSHIYSIHNHSTLFCAQYTGHTKEEGVERTGQSELAGDWRNWRLQVCR